MRDLAFHGGRGPATLASHRAVDIDELVFVAEELLPEMNGAGVTTRLLDPLGPAPRLRVEEDERVVDVALLDLARDLARVRTGGTTAGLGNALVRWFEARPATDAQAARGVAVVGLVQGGRRLCWQVAVPRGNTVVEWVPSIGADRRHVARIRRTAQENAEKLSFFPYRSGEVTVWICLSRPELSTAALTSRERFSRRTGSSTTEDLAAVVVPRRPLVCGDLAAVTRLTEEAVDPHVLLRLDELEEVKWR